MAGSSPQASSSGLTNTTFVMEAENEPQAAPPTPRRSQTPMGVSISAAVGSLLFGYDTGIIGGALLYIVPAFSLDHQPFLQGAVVSSALVGAVLGTAAVGPISDAFGRRLALLGSAVLFTAGGILMATAPTVWFLIFGRAVVGVAVGAASSAVPVFIAECAPAGSRGQLATLPQLMVSSGILLSYSTAFLLSLADHPSWRLMLGLSTLPALVFGALLLRLPESPRWLCLRGRRSEAVKACVRLGLPPTDLPPPGEGEGDERVSEEGVQLLQRSRLGGGGRAGMGPLWDRVKGGMGGLGRELKELVASRGSRNALLVGATLQAFQQLCGVNAIVYYTPQILQQAGAAHLIPLKEQSASLLATIVAYSLKIPVIFAAMALMDKAGRRKLLLASIPVMAMALGALAGAFAFLEPNWGRTVVAIVSISVYGCSFVMGLGPIPTILCSEIFPTHLRGTAVGLAVAVNFGANFGVSQAFPEMLSAIGPPPVFGGFAGVCLLAWIFIFFAVPETRGLPLEEACALFQEKRNAHPPRWAQGEEGDGGETRMRVGVREGGRRHDSPDSPRH